MPRSSLPDHIVALVLDHLKLLEFEDDQERRETGTRVSLVCKQWHLAGRRIAWHSVMLEWAADERLAQELLARPDVLAEVRRLTFQAELPAPGEGMRETDQDAAAKSVALVEACPALEALDVGLVRHDGYLLYSLAETSTARTLGELHLMVVLGNDFTLSDLVEALARFKNLNRLKLTICWVAGTAQADISHVGTYDLPVKDLWVDLVVPEPDKARLVCQALNILFDASKVESMAITGLDADATSLGWLLRYSKLDALALAVPGGETFAKSFPHVVAAISTLPRLETVLITPDEGNEPGAKKPFLSPVSLDQLLRSLPPCIRSSTVVGPVLNDELDILSERRVEPSRDDVSLKLMLGMHEGPEGNHIRATYETLVRRPEADGTVAWRALDDRERIGW
ncbi:hypothetical protein DMC30DRAFT_419559 [Rhodotorula diobovata]|uniref:F-box domain-containing protein n=1 Tax=Rhodotorula diobovata TaxID=5288 RepID=A0A5C5FLH9_9BASI|nr:hypothetical protein DMC30DRAFT_419559 [Rhodotorula diobovata]